jgi:hypothetical protein
LLQHLTGGFWGVAIRRVLEAGSRTLMWAPVLFLPVLLGLESLFEWARPEVVAADPILQHKAAYLNPMLFSLRALFYFLVWFTLAHFANKWSLQQDDAAAPDLASKIQGLAGGGLVLMVLTVTFSSFDWGMSLNAHWFSTIYGVMFLVGQALAALGFATLTVSRFVGHRPYSSVIATSTIHDLGKLLLAFVMLWAYMGLSQFLIVWSGNLPEEIPWYALRTQGGWQWVALALFAFHFALPFLMLLSRDIKRNPRLLGGIAAALLGMRVIDLFWLIGPDLHGEHGASHPGLSVHWMDLTAFVGLGGIWIWAYTRELASRPLLPVGEPEVQRLLEEIRA